VFIDNFEHLSTTDDGKTACEAGFARPRLASQLCTLVDGLGGCCPQRADERSQSVLVIGATSALESVDGALRRSGRFDRVFGHEGALPNWVLRPASKRLLDELHSNVRLADELAREKRRKSEMAARLDGMAEAQLCNICLSEPKTHAVLPCLHKCMCATCAAQIESGSSAPRCPICKGPSRGLGRVWE
jgi:SpoVK/Ycf46/Vps4 family AAA+-type ATPase